MKKGILMTFIFLLLLMPLVSATDVTLTVYGPPVHDIAVFVLQPGQTYQVIKSFPHQRTGFDGKRVINFSTDGYSEYGLFFNIQKDGSVIFKDRVENRLAKAVDEVYILVNESDVVDTSVSETEEVSEETNPTSTEETNVSETEEVSEETNPTSTEVSTSSTTGFSIKAIGSKISDNLYVAIGVLLLFVIGLFVLVRQKSFVKDPAFKTDDRPPTILADKELEEAERKIKQAQKEIDAIRKKTSDRASAQQRFLEAKKELEEVEKKFPDEDNAVSNSVAKNNFEDSQDSDESEEQKD